jgi:hypothetical protein
MSTWRILSGIILLFTIGFILGGLLTPYVFSPEYITSAAIAVS